MIVVLLRGKSLNYGDAMKRFFLPISILLLIAFSGSVYGQTRCPMGVQMGSIQCIPDTPEMGGQQIPSPKPMPNGEWIKTWGAIVNSKQISKAWASVGKPTKKSAEDDALDQCGSEGFQECYVSFTYMNQCVALASPASGNTGSGVSSAADINVASRNSLTTCQKKGGVNCSVIYKECTEPFFRKY
ncbi:DUF4189 domain-containing protein [Xanthomonas arboricola]|uniref:DUF4189 domain-containing protein n=1 Tax=Xanthomonas arboricola TaxID=56448 RepID=UPI00209C1DE9|nr:DUF4189 domain-containing protein [Xanthomonas arboricola]